MNITKLQDSDFNWYWIPNELVENFNKDSYRLSGMEYMDDPDSFETFSDNYSEYRTYGDPDLIPDIFAEEFEYEKNGTWVKTVYGLPSKKGYYKCLVSADGLGNLVETHSNLFNGLDWDLYESNVQFIEYWLASAQEYENLEIIKK